MAESVRVMVLPIHGDRGLERVMVRARVGYDGASEMFRFWWNDSAGGVGWRSFPTYSEALAAAIWFVSFESGGGPVSVSSDRERARIVPVAS